MENCLDTQHARTTRVMSAIVVGGGKWGGTGGMRPHTFVYKHTKKDPLGQFGEFSTCQ